MIGPARFRTAITRNPPQVKAPDAAGAGYGGDWSVRLAAARSPRAAAAVAAAAAEGEPAPYRRLSLLWYVLDGRLLEAELEAFPEGHSKKLGQVREGRRNGRALGGPLGGTAGLGLTALCRQ